MVKMGLWDWSQYPNQELERETIERLTQNTVNNHRKTPEGGALPAQVRSTGGARQVNLCDTRGRLECVSLNQLQKNVQINKNTILRVNTHQT